MLIDIFFHAGEDFVASNMKTYMIPISDMGVQIDPITVLNDLVPETDEVFSISLGGNPITLNVFPSTVPTEVTIEDDDGK